MSLPPEEHRQQRAAKGALSIAEAKELNISA